ncbi:hypothetical protein SAMN06265173_12642 [Thalassovita litoralis]|uniref:Helix-turn-helix domain-containing protein n=1 Tax=Thalassovita litoralis TaxID=1010611 RepID=A0A521FBR0_9RHOB|nr:hypothetical protein [Thalassovita litoralis]SMO93642.1 hypothetical protein SAMN06265173_12642 [Thalassovita litoralis]
MSIENKNAEKPKYVKLATAAKMYDTSRWKFDRLIKAGKLTKYEVLGSSMLKVEEIEALFESGAAA